MEGSIKPALSATYSMGDTAQFYGKFSGVGVRTYGTPPTLVGDDDSSFDVEDLYVGWRSGPKGDSDEYTLDFTLGRSQYTLGPRHVAVGRRRGRRHARRLLDRCPQSVRARCDRPLQARPSHLRGVLSRPGRDSGIGLRHQAVGRQLRVRDRRGHDARRDLHEMVRGSRRGAAARRTRRATTCAPTPRRSPSLKALSFEAEYALEDNDDALDSTAWNVLAAYQLEMAWQPKVSYRYAFFEGDDPATPENEAFDSLLTGFSRLGRMVAGRNRGRVLRLQLEPDLAPAARARDSRARRSPPA